MVLGDILVSTGEQNNSYMNIVLIVARRGAGRQLCTNLNLQKSSSTRLTH